jgi:hypothetical protein
MSYGGITFKHVWDFQLRIMMGNQYTKCKEATTQKEIIVACLRLGWNDAFRHTSKNIDGIDEKNKEKTIVEICKNISDRFIEYAQKATTEERHDYINGCLNDDKFKNEFAKIKVTDSGADKALCFGHIQKMFSMALKLFLCLKICAEQANDMGIDIGLNVEHFECNFSFETADCPIDSIIIGRLDKKMQDIKWSKLGQDDDHPSTDYIKVQKAIREQQNNDAKSNLCFDFENWN